MRARSSKNGLAGRLRLAGAHALMPLAATTSMLLLARRSTSAAALACRGFRRLCPVRVERGEDPHMPLASASTATTASHGAEPQLLPW